MARSILILEDDAFLAKYLSRLFSSRGYDVHAAGSVESFRTAAVGRRFDAVLLDLSLPDGNGLQAWAEARAAQDGAVAILMTAHGTADVALRAKAVGIPILLPKPLDLARLLSAVGAS